MLAMKTVPDDPRTGPRLLREPLVNRGAAFSRQVVPALATISHEAAHSQTEILVCHQL